MYIAQTNSTNTYLKEHPDLESVYTAFQTEGRGQTGNRWESEQGKNLLLSYRRRDGNNLASEQWQICMGVSVALWMTVVDYVDDASKLTIKWPNDLYYEDKKLAGVLIEHQLSGNYIAESIIGIGLNVNQIQWDSSAPNPVSIKQITGLENCVDELAEKLIENLDNIGVTSANWERIYKQHLYHREGFYWWEEREVSMAPTMNGERSDISFEAEIAGITHQGELVLRTRKGEEKNYHFKQIKYIL